MAADVLHVALGVPYLASAAVFGAALAAVFVGWQRSEHTLSIHSVDSARREGFYWAAVVATFALGTAVGDVTAVTLHLGYAASSALFEVLIAVPAVGWRWLRWNPIPAFWTAYVLTRPFGASVADWLGKPVAHGGLGLGAGLVSLAVTGLIVVLVAYLAVTRIDVQPAGPRGGAVRSGQPRDRPPDRARGPRPGRRLPPQSRRPDGVRHEQVGGRQGSPAGRPAELVRSCRTVTACQ